jgi:hypothetical protein
LTPRLALLASLALLWLNFLLTARWAHVPGALHGPKWPFVAALLALATALALRWKGGASTEPDTRTAAAEGRWILVAGVAALIAGLFVWFPPSTWTGIPYLDNWATRYQSTLDGLTLLKSGAATGWNWFFLGGYQISSDITQNLAAVAAIPVTLFGPAVGFHVLQFAMFLALPAFVYFDLRLSRDRDAAAFAAGLTCFTALCFSYLLVRSGDTNSLAGLSTTALALLGAHAAAAGRRWGGPVLVVAMALVGWSHVGFLIYAAILLALDALIARDGRRLARAIGAVIVGVAASLPLTWESWRYPSYFLPNNIIIDRAGSIDFMRAARDAYYNVEMLVQPGRWQNDFLGLTAICLPIAIYVAWTDRRSRIGFFAWALLAVVAMTRLNSAEFGYVFLRPVHLQSVLLPPVLAWFLIKHVPGRWLRLSVVALVAVYLLVWWQPVPHIRSEAEVEPALVERLRGLGGALVLVENAAHRDMDLSPATTSERTPFPVHVESLLPHLTGRRLYAGLWDGYQWTPARRQLLSGGAFMGRAIEDTPVAEVMAELHRWGVRHLLVWSEASKRYFRGDSRFADRVSFDRWTHFEWLDADSRSVATVSGSGSLEGIDPFAGTVRLADVGPGETVVVRTNFHPSWTARDDERAVALFEKGGQLAFQTPRGGSYDVTLIYPKRTWLLWLAALAIAVGIAASLFFDKRTSAIQ